MAVMIVSASIPFSLASASIVCINGFCIVTLGLKLHFQAAARNPSHRQPVHTLPRTRAEHDAPPRFAAAHDLPHFETVRPRDMLSNRADVLQPLHSSGGHLKPAQYPQIKKVGTSPLGDFLRVAAVKNITRKQ